MKDTKNLVIAALMAALTCAATMIIKIPTPALGYIHPGDGMVLLCGIILGPLRGALAAGVGSMFADVFSGYMSFAPGTLVIKALTAFAAGMLFHRLKASIRGNAGGYIGILLGGTIGELIMTGGYFLYETLLSTLSGSTAAAAFAASATGIPFNLVQGIVGIALAVVLYPILRWIPTVRF